VAKNPPARAMALVTNRRWGRLVQNAGRLGRQHPCVYRSRRSSLVSLQLALAPVVVFAIGVEHALPVAMDRLQHSHLSEDHRAAVLGRPRHQMSSRLHLLHFMF
jgi:hypothetical protein